MARPILAIDFYSVQLVPNVIQRSLASLRPILFGVALLVYVSCMFFIVELLRSICCPFVCSAKLYLVVVTFLLCFCIFIFNQIVSVAFDSWLIKFCISSSQLRRYYPQISSDLMFSTYVNDIFRPIQRSDQKLLWQITAEANLKFGYN